MVDFNVIAPKVLKENGVKLILMIALNIGVEMAALVLMK